MITGPFSCEILYYFLNANRLVVGENSQLKL
ncbi:hypothetical protein SAMN05443636_0012 [Halobaculum gomorrense]|uniref:Uncharacterized protein n=1 Tax=Halobaculum gomorrense TaxID=43928 RepID=A0A1M5J9S7_9EURY|nr:hypothetical protein SAMN05443636_0012 [Halobaculum gomorrense]